MTGSLGDRLDAIHVRVRAPGTEIEAELRHRREISISFGRGTYQWLDEAQLQRALTSLARLLYAGWLRQYRTALVGTSISIDEDPGFVAERDKIESEGRSDDGRITICAVGMENIQARVAPGTIRQLTEPQFTAGVRQAASAFLDDQSAKITALKQTYFAR